MSQTVNSTARLRHTTRPAFPGGSVWQRVKIGLIALAVGGLIPFSAAAEQGPEARAAAKQVIEQMYASLLDAMKNGSDLGYKGRYDKLSPVLRKSYNFPVMARASLGGNSGYWGQLDEAQQKQMIDAFSRMSVSTYASRFKKHTGQRFEVLEVKEARRSTLLVRSQIVRVKKKPASLNYLMRKQGESWRIIDVFFKGTISELAKNRSDYGSVVRRQGFDALIAALNAKVSKNEGP